MKDEGLGTRSCGMPRPLPHLTTARSAAVFASCLTPSAPPSSPREAAWVDPGSQRGDLASYRHRSRQSSSACAPAAGRGSRPPGHLRSPFRPRRLQAPVVQQLPTAGQAAGAQPPPERGLLRRQHQRLLALQRRGHRGRPQAPELRAEGAVGGVLRGAHHGPLQKAAELLKPRRAGLRRRSRARKCRDAPLPRSRKALAAPRSALERPAGRGLPEKSSLWSQIPHCSTSRHLESGLRLVVWKLRTMPRQHG